MSYARARKHYRAAQREMEELAEFNDGCFITRAKLNKLAAAAFLLALVLFFKGIVLGYIFFHDNSTPWS